MARSGANTPSVESLSVTESSREVTQRRPCPMRTGSGVVDASHTYITSVLDRRATAPLQSGNLSLTCWDSAQSTALQQEEQ